jgi:hypothetical protein
MQGVAATNLCTLLGWLPWQWFTCGPASTLMQHLQHLRSQVNNRKADHRLYRLLDCPLTGCMSTASVDLADSPQDSQNVLRYARGYASPAMQ